MDFKKFDRNIIYNIIKEIWKSTMYCVQITVHVHIFTFRDTCINNTVTFFYLLPIILNLPWIAYMQYLLINYNHYQTETAYITWMKFNFALLTCKTRDLYINTQCTTVACPGGNRHHALDASKLLSLSNCLPVNIHLNLKFRIIFTTTGSMKYIAMTFFGFRTCQSFYGNQPSREVSN